MLDNYRDLGKCNFECGDYKSARNVLENYISFFAKPPSIPDSMMKQLNPNQPKDQEVGKANICHLQTVTMELLPVLWGKLAAELKFSWKTGRRLVSPWWRCELDWKASYLPTNSHPSLLQQRTWLLHWSLVGYWNVQGRLENMVDLMHSERYKHKPLLPTLLTC